MSFFLDSSMTRHFPLENSTMKSWSHIWLMLNRFTLRLFTYRTFAMFGSPGREMIPFPLIYDLLPSPKVTLQPFLDSKILMRDRSPVMRLEQPLSRYHKHMSITLNVDFIMKHTSCLADISGGMVFSPLPFMNKAFNFHSSQTNSFAHFHSEAV